MCGINGFNWKDEILIHKMDEVTKHRGPDATNIFVDEGVSLGHNRLSILDLSAASGQPMKSNDGRYQLVYNGELYNFQELKSELTEYVWHTKGDTEVILAAYVKWGKECVKKFNGIFSLAIWDSETKELFLARDHNGIKPLYYYLDTKNSRPKLIFSSEIKGILEHNIPRVLRPDSLSYYLRVLYVPEPYTMFQDILKLPAAHYAIFKNGKFELVRYWNNDLSKVSSCSKKEYESKLRNVIADAVKRQLISDRPVGLFLSGGIDSTVILHHVAKLRDNINTYSVGFDLTSNEQEEKFNQDFNLARETAKQYKTNHHEILLSADDVLQNLEKAVWHLDEPIANPTIVAQYILSQFSRESVVVVLSGDGGDELFGGYDRYRYSLWSTYYRKIPAVIRKIFNKSAKFRKLDIAPGVDRYAQFLFQKDSIIQEVAPKYVDKNTRTYFQNRFFSGMDFDYKTEISFDELFMEIDRKSWLTDEALLRTDKMTMAHAIESRVPFLDKEVIDFAAKLPLKYKFNLFRTKILVRDAYKGLIPDFIYNQPKRGWFSPGAKWLRNDKIFSLAKDILSRDYYPPTQELFDWGGIKKVLEDHKDSKRYNSVMLWSLIIFQMWAKRYKIEI